MLPIEERYELLAKAYCRLIGIKPDEVISDAGHLAWQLVAHEAIQGMNHRNLPDIELVAARVHQQWMDTKLAQGVTTRLAEDGEELMVPYEELSEKQKQTDRNTVIAVYKAIEELT